ncbi:unnamed protein product [Orchesella dallaii]|uniref:Uncharacterized protein n=1 Tax=Orchesella dallaii TaxID=48710 RepID=A0ABP1S0C4_9HEXA
MSSLKIPRKTIVILNILCILLQSPTLDNLVTGLKTHRENLNVPGGIKFYFPNLETGIQLAANAEDFQDGTFPIAFQMKSPSYQHKMIRLHEEPGTGSVRIRYPTKGDISNYMLSQPLRHPIAGRPDIVVNGNVFPWVLNNDEDNHKQTTFHPTNFQAGSPSMIPYSGARPNESVGTVPIKWLNSSKTVCKWPPRDYGKAIRHNKEPDDSWSTYPVRVLSKNPIRDYKTARNLEKKAEFTSSLETTDADCERRKKQRRTAKPKEPCLALVRDSGSSSDNPQSDQSSRN